MDSGHQAGGGPEARPSHGRDQRGCQHQGRQALALRGTYPQPQVLGLTQLCGSAQLRHVLEVEVGLAPEADLLVVHR